MRKNGILAPSLNENLLPPTTTFIETYSVNDENIERLILKRDGDFAITSFKINNNTHNIFAPDALFDKIWLTLKTPPSNPPSSTTEITLVDLFAGLGGMTLGVMEAGRALGLNVVPRFALDFNKDAIDTYKVNFPSCECSNADITQIIDGDLGAKITNQERRLRKALGSIDIVIGGPPCQGNSDLNNHTRRKDPKNTLLLKVVRFAELFSPKHLVIENVQGVQHDQGQVTLQAKNYLQKLGYFIDEGLLLASNFGVAQKRRRYFLVATKSPNFSFDAIKSFGVKDERTFLWACADLMQVQSDTIFDSSATHSPINQKRIKYLFKHNLYELPDAKRPDCHKNGNHSYKSVYGRMYPDKAAPTITSGFGSIGQGRFCHPFKERSITPHEAARLQFIPDFFQFLPETKRVSLQKMIGNAVPSKLSYRIFLELLR